MKAEQKGKRGFQVSDTEEPRAEGALPPMNFVTLVLSLSTSALVHLGVAPSGPGSEAGSGGEAEPGSETPPEKNLPLARQTIDILDMLREKTQGNLTDEEDKLLEHVLHDLHLRFVHAS